MIIPFLVRKAGAHLEPGQRLNLYEIVYFDYLLLFLLYDCN
jgi:hypothetical protein